MEGSDSADIGPQPRAQDDDDNQSNGDDIGPKPPTSRKDSKGNVDSDNDGDDFGPKPHEAKQSAGDNQDDGDDGGEVGPSVTLQTEEPKRKRRKVDHEDVLLQSLPNAGMYERSYMHRDVVVHTCVASTEFIVTASNDGQLKFWKKMPTGVEFVKQYRAHMGELRCMVASADGQFLATISNEKSAKIFHVTTFDMIRMIKLEFEPGVAAWVYDPRKEKPLLVISCKQSGDLWVFDTSSSTSLSPVRIAKHTAPVTAIAYNRVHKAVVSADETGMLEYWSPTNDNGELPEGTVKFELKTETSLTAFVTAKARVHHIAVSNDGKLFATTSSDMIVRVFRFATGKLTRAYDESLVSAHKIQRSPVVPNPYKLDHIDFGRRMAVEKELYKSDMARLSNVVFDESDTFIIFPTYLGIKVLNIVTNKVKALLGKVENTERFLSVSLYQGRPTTNIYTPVARDVLDDPTIVCAAYKKQRFYMFTRREPEESASGVGRDTLNEKPSKDHLLASQTANNPLGSEAVMHTTMGDITIKLFPDDCPRTVENFSTHAKNGYFNNMIFHRVIKGFMVQTGCPLGDGTGGVSIWGGEFEDEIRRDLRHDRPYTVSMANGGPNTNGSQFFITTQPAQWLDGKHTVFGRVVQGMEVVGKIEKLKTDKFDKPLEPPKIINVDVVE